MLPASSGPTHAYIGVHLIGLCLQLEYAAAPELHDDLLKRLPAAPPPFEWREPPGPNGSITVAGSTEMIAPWTICAG